MIATTSAMTASLNRERYRKHRSPEDEEKDMEVAVVVVEEAEEEELDDNKSPMRSPLDLGMAVLMASERSSAGKDSGEGEASREIRAWSWGSSSREMYLHLCRVQ